MDNGKFEFDERLKILTTIVETQFDNNYSILNVLNEEDKKHISEICGLTNINYDIKTKKIEALMSKKEPELSDFLNMFTLHSATNNGIKLSIPVENYIAKLDKSVTKLEESNKKSEEKKSEDPVKEEEKPEIKETVKPEEPKKEVITIPPDNKEEQPLLIDTSGLLDKWSKKSIDQFNDDLNTIKQDEKVKANKISADNFNNLKLVGIKGKIDENIKFVLVNVKSNIIFEVFKTKKYDKDKNENNINIQISTFPDVFDYKSTLYKRQSEARQKHTKKERDEYLNQYCYVDFKLLPREEKLA